MNPVAAQLEFESKMKAADSAGEEAWLNAQADKADAAAKESKVDAAATPKAKKAPAAGYVPDKVDDVFAAGLAICVGCYRFWMCQPDGYHIMLQSHHHMAMAFPNSIAKCWDCGSRL